MSRKAVAAAPIRRLILIASALLTAILVVTRVSADVGAPLPFDRLGTPVSPDLANRLTAARLVLSGRSTLLYDQAIQRAELAVILPSPSPPGEIGSHFYFEPFVAPPIDAILYLPIAGIPYLAAAEIWFGISLAFLILAVRLFWPLLTGLHRQSFAPWALLFGFSLPVLAVLSAGQDTALSLLLLVVGFRLLHARQDAAAGIVLALGLFKPQIFGLIPIFLLFRRNWPALVAWTATAIGLSALSVAMIGTNGIPNYLRLLSSDQMGGIIVKLGWQMATLPALLRAIFPTGSASAAILADGILLIAYVHRVRTLDLSDAFALTIAVTVLATPYLFLYDSTVLLIPVTVALAKYPRSSGTAWIVAAGYALLSTAILRCSLFGGYPYPLSLLGAPWAAVAVVALALVLGRGAATSDPRMITG